MLMGIDRSTVDRRRTGVVHVWVPVLAATLGLWACASAGPEVSGPERAAGPADDFARQILVTLRQPSPAPVQAAGSTSAPYSSADYFASGRTRRRAARLGRDYGLDRSDGWPIRSLGVYCVVFEVPATLSVEAVIARLQQDERVDSVQRMQSFETLGRDAAEDPYANLQHSLDAMRVRGVHRWAGGRGVSVAVIDTGVDRRHADLVANVGVTRDFVESRGGARREVHGTAVAGVIAAGANGVGTVGVAPQSTVLALRACWEAPGDAVPRSRGREVAEPRRSGGTPSKGRCSSYTLAKALAYVVDMRPDIANLSLKGPRDPLLERLLREAVAHGVTVVTAHPEGPLEASFPAAVDGVIVVESAGLDVPEGQRPSWLLHATGTDVLAAVPGNRFDFVSGNSFAAAHVSGIVALLLERAPGLSVERVHEILFDTSRTVAGADGRAVRLVDACAALSEVDTLASCAEPGDVGAAAAGAD